MHEIVKGVAPEMSRRKAVKGRVYPYAELDVGDMFFVPNRPTNNLMTHSSNMGKRLGRRFSTRHVWKVRINDAWEPANQGDEGAVLGIAVHRIE